MAMKPETRAGFFQRFAPLVVSPSLECPIYYLHEVTSRVAFTRFVDNLLSSNGQAIICADLLNYFETCDRTWSGKPFMLTFDDGRYDSPTLELVAQFYKGALSILPGTRQFSDERYLLRRLVKNL